MVIHGEVCEAQLRRKAHEFADLLDKVFEPLGQSNKTDYHRRPRVATTVFVAASTTGNIRCCAAAFRFHCVRHHLDGDMDRPACGVQEGIVIGGDVWV